jgi:DNA processing protein
MHTKEAPYWIAIAHLPRWGAAKINALVIKFIHEEKITIEDFFHLEETKWKSNYGLITPDINDLLKAKSDLPGLASLAESLLNEGYEIIPLNSPEYSPTLKSNLKATHSPVILYIKGNKNLMKEKSISIVGSREASETSLKFADNIAKLASKEYKVIVSGFAKGVDKQALDSTIKYRGQSIIVLPQGILTFVSGFKTYYKQIVGGDVLVLSTFFPRAPWQKELAMARNPIIYGLADEIYVAESSEKGGTWSGVVDGLRKKRKIFVRNPYPNEKNANGLLIQKGAMAVDFNGKVLFEGCKEIYLFEQTPSTVNEPLVREENEKQIDESIEDKILNALNGSSLTAKELLTKLNLSWSSQKLNTLLKKNPQIEIIKTKKTNQFRLKENFTLTQRTLFDKK